MLSYERVNFIPSGVCLDKNAGAGGGENTGSVRPEPPTSEDLAGSTPDEQKRLIETYRLDNIKYITARTAEGWQSKWDAREKVKKNRILIRTSFWD